MLQLKAAWKVQLNGALPDESDYSQEEINSP